MSARQRLQLPAVGIWTPALDTVPTARARELAVELEELGYGALWVPEGAGRDPFTTLALLLASTSRLVGGTGIANIYARDPLSMASAARSLTEAFPDRVLVGLGVSHANLVSGVRGHSYGKPLATMDTYLDGVLGATFTAVPPPHEVRYVLAALRRGMLGLAAKRTAGAHPYLVTPEHTASARALMGPAAVLCPEQTVVLESDPAAARTLARRFLDPYLAMPNYAASLEAMGFGEEDQAAGGSDRLVDALVAWGDEEQIRTRVVDHLAAGADHVAVQVVVDAGHDLPRLHWQPGLPDTQWRVLAPALRGLR